MRTSARNQLPGVVRSIKLGGIMAQVEVAIGEHRVTAVITRESAEELHLQEGDEVAVIIKSTEVMIGKDDAGEGQ